MLIINEYTARKIVSACNDSLSDNQDGFWQDNADVHIRVSGQLEEHLELMKLLGSSKEDSIILTNDMVSDLINLGSDFTDYL